MGNIMNGANTYFEAVSRMRRISKDIHEVFEVKAINTVKEKIRSLSNNDQKFNICSDADWSLRG